MISIQKTLHALCYSLHAARYQLCALRFVYFAFCLLTFCFLGCSPGLRVNLDTSMEDRIFWPGAPEKPRIRYLWSLYSLLPEGSSMLDLLAGKYEFYDVKDAPMLMKPMHVYKRADNLYVADAGAGRVTVMNLRTKEIFHAGIAGQGSLSLPVCVVSDRDGNIYVSDSAIRKVYKYDPRGTFLKAFSLEGVRPVGLAYDDRSDILYITDTDNHTIYVVDREGSVQATIGKRGEADGEFNYPTYLWVDNAGRLYVSDTINARIQVFDNAGRFLFRFGVRGSSYEELEGPKGVAVDTYGNIYVVDSQQATVKIFNREGRLLLFFGEEGAEHGNFDLPNGIFVDKDNAIYVADTYNMRIQTFQLIEKNGK